MERKGDWIQTYTGKLFYPLDPKVDEVDLIDIAHSISHQCRFAGHCREFYSIAEHSVRLSEMIQNPKEALWGLLHDASEAYLVDLPRPVKHYSGVFEVYKDIEYRLTSVIMTRFGLSAYTPPSVKAADGIMLFTEARDLMAPPPVPWRNPVEPLSEVIIPWIPVVAKANFLERFVTLWEETHGF